MSLRRHAFDEPAFSFPTVEWKNETATFIASATPDAPKATSAGVAVRGAASASTVRAALVFPFYGDKVVLGDITHRGWCIPSGHIEAGETPEAAVRREAHEEAGVVLGRVAYLGHFVLTHRETGQITHAPTFIGQVANFGQIPDGSESRGMLMVDAEDVAGLYFSWDALLADVFAYAWTQKAVRFPVGMSLAALTGD